jgi:hypothetical protein
MRYCIALSFLLIFETGCYTEYYAPGAVGRVIDSTTGTPVRGARVTRLPTSYPWGSIYTLSATAITDKNGAFDLPPDAHTVIAFMYLPNPEALSGSFTVSADSYITNELSGSATSHTFWRAKFGV